MLNIGEQIRVSRKSMGMTQDDLAEKMSVTRSSIANWETGRRLPDLETMVRLSQVLNQNFIETSSEEEEPDVSAEIHEMEEESVIPTDSTETEDISDSTDTSEFTETTDNADVLNPIVSVTPKQKRLKNRSGFWVLAALAGIIVCIILIGHYRSQPKEVIRPFKAQDGEMYTVERFAQESDNDRQKAYLRVNPSLTIQKGEHKDYWVFNVEYSEINGVALSIDRIERVYFAREKENVEQILTASDIRAAGLGTDIAAYGNWVFSGGLPVQDTVLGAGILLRGTDENGEAVTFSTYIPFS